MDDNNKAPFSVMPSILGVLILTVLSLVALCDSVPVDTCNCRLNNVKSLSKDTESLLSRPDLLLLLLSSERKKRNDVPSLSVVNPLDVLRQRLLIEIARQRVLHNQNQIDANSDLLQHIGKRPDSNNIDKRRSNKVSPDLWELVQRDLV